MRLKDKLKKSLESGKRMARKAIDTLVLTAAIACAIGGIGLLAANAPYLHKSWLRNSVGKEVVMIVKRDEAGRIRGGGTGFHVKGQSGVTYILTNAHVCEAFDDGQVWVKTNEEDSRVMPRRIIEISEKTDLCLVEGLPNHDGLELASNDGVGKTLAVIGHPVLMPLSISVGDILAKQTVEYPIAQILPKEYEDKADGKRLMTEAQCKSKPKYKVGKYNTWFGEINVCIISLQANVTNIVGFPGNSGSPAVDFWGNVAGVLYSGDGYTNYSNLISLSDIKEFLKPY